MYMYEAYVFVLLLNDAQVFTHPFVIGDLACDRCLAAAHARIAAKWRRAAYAEISFTSYLAIHGSRVTSVRSSAVACATSIRSNGSRW